LEEKKIVNLVIGSEQIILGTLTLLPLSQETTLVIFFLVEILGIGKWYQHFSYSSLLSEYLIMQLIDICRKLNEFLFKIEYY